MPHAAAASVHCAQPSGFLFSCLQLFSVLNIPQCLCNCVMQQSELGRVGYAARDRWGADNPHSPLYTLRDARRCFTQIIPRYN